MNKAASNDFYEGISENYVEKLTSNKLSNGGLLNQNDAEPFFSYVSLIDNLFIPSLITDENRNIFTNDVLRPEFSELIKNIDGKMIFEDRKFRERFMNFVKKIEENNPKIFSIRDIFSIFEDGKFKKIVTLKSMTDMYDQHRILISVLTLEYVHTLNPVVLQDLFGFTPGEGRLAALLANGKSVIECADKLGIRISTVREKLSNIFAKTGTSRQSELVSMLSRLELLA